MKKRWISRNEAADKYGFSVQTFSNWAEAGYISCRTVTMKGKPKYYYDDNELATMVSEMETIKVADKCIADLARQKEELASQYRNDVRMSVRGHAEFFKRCMMSGLKAVVKDMGTATWLEDAIDMAFHGDTLEEIAEVCHVSRERVRQKINSAAYRLKDYSVKLDYLMANYDRFQEHEAIIAGKDVIIEQLTQRVEELEERQREPVDENLARLLGTPLGDLNLSIRTYNALYFSGYKTVADVVTKPLFMIKRTRNLGKKGLGELMGVVEVNGLTFGMKL